MINGIWNWGKKFYCNVQFSFSQWNIKNGFWNKTLHQTLALRNHSSKSKIKTSQNFTWAALKLFRSLHNAKVGPLLFPLEYLNKKTISFTVKSCSNQFYCLLCNKSKMNNALDWSYTNISYNSYIKHFTECRFHLKVIRIMCCKEHKFYP